MLCKTVVTKDRRYITQITCYEKGSEKQAHQQPETGTGSNRKQGGGTSSSSHFRPLTYGKQTNGGALASLFSFPSRSSSLTRTRNQLKQQQFINSGTSSLLNQMNECTLVLTKALALNKKPPSHVLTDIKKKETNLQTQVLLHSIQDKTRLLGRAGVIELACGGGGIYPTYLLHFLYILFRHNQKKTLLISSLSHFVYIRIYILFYYLLTFILRTYLSRRRQSELYIWVKCGHGLCFVFRTIKHR